MGCCCSKKKRLEEAEVVLSEEAKDMFDVLDADGNGQLTSVEVMGLLKNAGFDASYQDVIDFINIHDKDGDGKISYKEFRLVLKGNIQARASNWVALFNKYDMDHDKHIEYSEFIRVLDAVGVNVESLSPRSSQLIDEYFPSVYSKVDFKTFCKLLKNFV